MIYFGLPPIMPYVINPKEFACMFHFAHAFGETARGNDG
jgi:hypothetical protein